MTKTRKSRSRFFGAAASVVFVVTGASAYERLDQGAAWDASAWNAYYTQDQGSRLIPFAWAKALRLPNGKSFLADGLARYGYLPNPDSPTASLPVGFLVADGHLSLNCAACHTRELSAGGKSYRIDGGPALADIGALWFDLDVAVKKILDDSSAFSEFAKEVLPSMGVGETESNLRARVVAWHARHHAITSKGLPTAPDHKPWGVGRLDAVGMILNRVVGLDIGASPSHIIPENITLADAPVRPPFLWYAWKQDRTQWPGFADNGDRILAMSRNIGQVYGVFGEFHPKKDATVPLLGYDYVDENSTNFQGLRSLEHLIEKIEPPKWPWPIDEALAEKGQAIFKRRTDLKNPGVSGCADCHWERPGEKRLLNKDTWCTPVQDVGTDAREYQYLKEGSLVLTGVMEGAEIPLVGDGAGPLKAKDSPIRVLGTAVRGALIEHFAPVILDKRPSPQLQSMLGKLVPAVLKLAGDPVLGTLKDLKGAYKTPEQLDARDGLMAWTTKCSNVPAPPGKIKFESRVLHGVWAAAPYLHNGSVPTLAELLKPDSQRVGTFKVGANYDIVNVGLAAEQSGVTTAIDSNCDRMSGDSHCGHNYGTTLPEEEKKALLEYLKKL